MAAQPSRRSLSPACSVGYCKKPQPFEEVRSKAGHQPRAENCRLNQKGRAAAFRQVAREDLCGVRGCRSGGNSEEERIRLAREIKQNLFAPARQDDDLITKSEDDELLSLDSAWNQLETALRKIPTPTTEKSRVPGRREDSDLERGGARRDPSEPLGGDQGERKFGQSISEIFNHSWRPAHEEQWIWVPKPALLGEPGYPARPEEIRREGWHARRVVRVLPPPLLSSSFTEATLPMAREEPRN